MRHSSVVEMCVCAAAFACAGSVPAVRAQTAEAEAAFRGTWFSPSSPWNLPITAGPDVLEGSRGFIAAYLAGGRAINLNTEVWTPAVLFARSGLPRCDVTDDEWRLEGLPLHPDMEKAIDFFAYKGDTDASFCIFSEAKRAFYNLWNVRLETIGVQRRLLAGAFGVFPLRGSGWWDNTLGPWTGRSSGASYCGGLVRNSEFTSGVIDHALAFGWPKRLVRADALEQAFVFPARTTDGSGVDPKSAAPMGARLQLDPDLDDDQLRALGVGETELPIARALQSYGAYLVDSTDNVMALYAESSLGRPGPVDRRHGPLPAKLLQHARFVAPPAETPLDSRISVGQPVHVGKEVAQHDTCILPPGNVYRTK